MNKLILLLFFQFFALITTATITLPPFFSDHMIIQRNKPVRVWGWAAPGERITIKIAYASTKVRAGKNGKFEGLLPAMPAGGPYTLTISGSNTITINDVLAGEIWICSGQSNMEWELRNTNNAEKEINLAALPQIRQFKVPHNTAFKPVDKLVGGQWQICTPETAGGFTAVGYYFAREILRELNVPVGLINSSWGGTDIESWISGDAFFNEKIYTPLQSKMPTNVDSVRSIKKKRINALIHHAQDRLPTAVEEEQFKTQSYNDANWKTMKLPGTWENAGFPELGGVVWFRKTFALDAVPSANAILS